VSGGSTFVGSINARNYLKLNDYEDGSDTVQLISRDSSLLLWNAPNGLVLKQYADGAVPAIGTGSLLLGGSLYSNSTLVMDGSRNLFNLGNVDIVGSGAGAIHILAGADVGAATRTNSTRKYIRLGMPHYLNAEEPVGLIIGDSDGSNNYVNIGGNSSAINAATNVRIFAAANTTTTIGTLVGQFTTAGFDIASGVLKIGGTQMLSKDGTELGVHRRIYLRNGAPDAAEIWMEGVDRGTAGALSIGNVNGALYFEPYGDVGRIVGTWNTGAKIEWSNDGGSFLNLVNTAGYLNLQGTLVNVTGPVTMSGILTVNGAGTSVISGDLTIADTMGIYNPSFTSGWAGSKWRLDQVGSKYELELDNLWVRGSLSVYELIIQQIRATNGSVYVSAAQKVDAVITPTVGAEVVDMEDPAGHDVSYFAPGDLILMQRVKVTDPSTLVKRLVRKVSSVSGRRVTFTTATGGPVDVGTMEAGDDFVRIGSETDLARRGSVYLTSDDSNAPFIDVVDGVSAWSEWKSSSKLKVRLGKLSGIAGLSGYGSYISSTAGGILLQAEDTTSKIALGSSPGSITVSGTEVGFIVTGAGDMKVYADGSNFIRKSGSSLEVKASTFTLTGSTTLYISSVTPIISLGTSASSITVANANAGVAMDGAGGFKAYQDSSNYLRISGGSVDIRASVFKLSATGVLIDGPAKSFGLGATSETAGVGLWAEAGSGVKVRIGGVSGSPRLVFDDGVGLTVFDYLDQPVLFADLAGLVQFAGWTADASSLYSGTDIVLDALAKKISIASGGMQLGYQVSGLNSGLLINTYNYWFTSGSFRAGVAAAGVSWDGTTFKVTANSLDIITATASAATIATWTADVANSRLYSVVSPGVNGSAIYLTASGSLSKPVIVASWGDGVTSESSGNNYISLGGQTYLNAAVGPWVSGWEAGGGGLSINVGGVPLFFAGKRATGGSGALIAGWLFDAGKFYSGSGSNFVGMKRYVSAGSDIIFFGGATDSSGTAAKFQVTADGSLTATAATIKTSEGAKRLELASNELTWYTSSTAYVRIGSGIDSGGTRDGVRVQNGAMFSVGSRPGSVSGGSGIELYYDIGTSHTGYHYGVSFGGYINGLASLTEYAALRVVTGIDSTATVTSWYGLRVKPNLVNGLIATSIHGAFAEVVTVGTGVSNMYGFFGKAGTGGGNAYGGYFEASAGTITYGIYAAASGGTTRWAAYLDGILGLKEVTASYGLTAGAECAVYMKGDKLIIKFNDSGTTRYKYLDLTGSGVTWAHATTEP
jgi:hypothetical protein